MNPRFLAAAQDPRLIPGVSHYCDEWCTCCPVTDRCLAYKCVQIYRSHKGLEAGDQTFDDVHEAAELTRQIRQVEGASTDDLDAILAGRRLPWKATPDPLLDLAFGYAAGAEFVFRPTAGDLRRWMTATAPEPRQVVIYYHLRIYVKLVRALGGLARTADGGVDRAEDAAGCAKLTLVSIERSRQALQTLLASPGVGGIAPLLTVLDQIEHGIDGRLPAARTFVRVGLDVPAAA